MSVGHGHCGQWSLTSVPLHLVLEYVDIPNMRLLCLKCASMLYCLLVHKLETFLFVHIKRMRENSEYCKNHLLRLWLSFFWRSLARARFSASRNKKLRCEAKRESKPVKTRIIFKICAFAPLGLLLMYTWKQRSFLYLHIANQYGHTLPCLYLWALSSEWGQQGRSC